MNSSEIRPFKETGQHSYHRRAFSHDYFSPFIYHIIIKKTVGCESFGHVEGDARIKPGTTGCAFIKESELGKTIAKSILHFPYIFPIVKLYQFCVMPDHIHLLIRILSRSDKHLDFYIDKLKQDITSRYSSKTGHPISTEEIFEPGYCDKPLYDDRSLDNLFRYIRENPHRLAMRKQFPHFFRRIRKLIIGGKEYEAYGNLFLLRNPDKEAVKISRSFTPEEKTKKKNSWLTAASQGTILVSPFISPAEKEIRAAAENLGAKIILITHETFPERYKPHAHDFSLCAKGDLLIISIGLPAGTPLSRRHCIQMNELAELISHQ
ncbi:MAG: transposase [Muribaculaceae bacterium]|nr:transposase [Muribaculaceae bacterium]